MAVDIAYELAFEGRLADNQLIDFYDVSEALRGFQRTLALTAHLVLNDEIITQAPSLKRATIYAHPPEAGSWKMVATLSLAGTAFYNVITAPKDTVLGHIVVSLYDYVLMESFGFHVDFNKTIGQQLEEARKQHGLLPQITQEKADSLIEKCETSLVAMHRPIVKSGTADRGVIRSDVYGQRHESQNLTSDTYAFISASNESERPIDLIGKVGSYNINTFKGRIFDPRERRPIPFVLSDSTRDQRSVALVTGSLNANALNRSDFGAYVKITAYRVTSPNGRLKSLVVISIDSPTRLELTELLDDLREF